MIALGWVDPINVKVVPSGPRLLRIATFFSKVSALLQTEGKADAPTLAAPSKVIELSLDRVFFFPYASVAPKAKVFPGAGLRGAAVFAGLFWHWSFVLDSQTKRI